MSDIQWSTLSPRTKRNVIAFALAVVVFVVVGVIGLIVWAAINTPGWKAERMATFEAKVAAGRSAIRQGRMESAQLALTDALVYYRENRSMLDGAEIENLSGLIEQCRAAGNDKKVEETILSMTDKEFQQFTKTGRIDGKTYFDDPEINAYYASALEARRGDAEQLRSDAAKRKAEERKQQEIAAKQAARDREIAAKEARSSAISARANFADELERQYLDQGMDVYVTVFGPENTTIKLQYILMSRPLVHQINNDGSTMSALRSLGFKKFILSDGYDSTWTFDL